MNSSATVHSARPAFGAHHRLDDWLFPPLSGWKRALVLFLYYLAVIVALLVIYGRGDFATAPFIYQGF